MGIRLGRTVKCKKCKNKAYGQDAYRRWSNVDCFSNITSPNDLIDITWIENWWLCGRCYKPAYEGETRFHDIDGFTYFLSWKFPFVERG